MYRVLRLGLALAAVLAMAAPVAGAQRSVVLEFEKECVEPGYCSGTLTGGGTIEMFLFDDRIIGNTQHFSARVEIQGSTEGSFTAVVSGQINFSSLKAALNGTVTGGPLDGARVHEESQLDPATGVFEGSIRLMPAS